MISFDNRDNFGYYVVVPKPTSTYITLTPFLGCTRLLYDFQVASYTNLLDLFSIIEKLKSAEKKIFEKLFQKVNFKAILANRFFNDINLSGSKIAWNN